MGKVSHDVHGAWDESLHPRDAQGHFISKGSKVRLPDGSVGKVVASRDSTIGAVITVQRKDGSTLHIPSSQTAKTSAKVSNDPVRQGGLPNDFLSNHTPERGALATANNTTPGHRMAVAGGRTGTITAVRPASGTATYVEDGTERQRVGQLGRMTHLGAYQPDRGTPANLRNTQPGHHVAFLTPDEAGNKTARTGTVLGVHANPGTNVPTATIARDGSGDITEHPLSNVSHLPTISQLAHGNPPPRLNTPIVADDARAKMVEQAMKKAVAEGKTTDAQFKDPKTKLWSQDRAAIHQQIVDEVYAKYANVPNDGKAIMAGGLPGAGKTTILKKNTDLSQYVTLNPDDMKEELIKRGLAPQVPGLTPMESVMLIHQESSDLTKMLAARAYADHKNVLWDITMQSPDSVGDRLRELKANGYSTKGVFVSTTMERSLQNVRNRWEHGIQEYNQGKGFGGRYVPEHISRSAASENALYRSKNEDVFSQFRREMDDWELYDNSQNQQRLVTSKSHTQQVGDSEDVPLSINDPQPGADKFLPETPAEEPKPEPEPPTTHADGVPLDGPGNSVAERFQAVDPISPNPADTRRRLFQMANASRREGYNSQASQLQDIANANDLTVSHDGTVAGGSPVQGNGGRGAFQVVGVGSGTPLRPRNAPEPQTPEDKQQLVNDLAAVAPFGNPAVANRWQDRDQRVADQQGVTDAWNRIAPPAPAAPTTDGPAYGNGSPVQIGDRVSYGNPDNPRTGTVSDVHANGSISVRRDGGNHALEGDDLVGGPGALTPLAPTTTTPDGTGTQVGDRVRYDTRDGVSRGVEGYVTRRTQIGNDTYLQVERDNGMYDMIRADDAHPAGPGASETRDRRGNTIRVGDQVYVGSGTGKVVSISPDGQTLRVGRSTDGADPFQVRTEMVDSVSGYTPFGAPPQVGEKINAPYGDGPAIVTEATPSSARRGDYLITYKLPDGSTGTTRLSQMFLNGPNAPKPVSRDGQPLAVGDRVQWGNSGLSIGGTGQVTAIQPNLDAIASGSPGTHQLIIRGDDGNERAVNNDRLTHWQPTVGQEILHNGERGTVTHVDPPSSDGQFPGVVQYKTADGQIRATDPKNTMPAPPPLPDDLSMTPVPESTFRRWGPRAAEIAATAGPNLSAAGLDLNSGAHKEAFLKSLTDMYNGGENGGLGKGGKYKVQANNVINFGGSTQYNGSIIGPEGERVGNFTRTIHYKNGKPSEIHNDLMQISSDHQGQGIARDFYRRQENWAIKNGIPKITVQANINVGGYTWGRLGYDWQSKRSGRTYAQNMMNRITRDSTTNARKPSYDKGDKVVVGRHSGEIADVSETTWGRRTYQVKLDDGSTITAYPQEVLSAAVKDNQAWNDLQAIQAKMIDDPTYVPTPYELGKIGYTPGQTSWPGKNYMLGTSWYGVKRLNPRNSLANATEETQRSATASAFGGTGYGGDPKFHVGPEFPHKWSELEAASPHPPTVQTLGPDEEIHSTQSRLDPAAVERYKAGKPGPEDNPHVAPRVAVTKDGRKHVLNGHHRILAKRQQGQGTHVLVLPGHVPDDSAAGVTSDGDPKALATFAWDESLHPRGKDGRYITKGGFVRLPNGITGTVVGSKAGKDGEAVVHVKTDGPDGKTVSVAAKQLTQAPGYGPKGTPMAHTRKIQTHPNLPADQLINSIKANGGFTYDPKTGGLLIPGQDKGFAVAVPGTEHIVGNGQVTRAAFKKAVVKVLYQYQPQIRAGAKLGGWFSEERNAYMVELTDILPQEDPEGAIAEGKKRNQEGIYDIGNDKFIATGGTGDA